MKKLVILALTLVGAAALASDRMDRIVNDPIIEGAVHGFEVKTHLRCQVPSEKDIHFRCLNGPGCSYTLAVTCSSGNINNRSTAIEIIGFDNGQYNEVSKIEFHHVM